MVSFSECPLIGRIQRSQRSMTDRGGEKIDTTMYEKGRRIKGKTEERRKGHMKISPKEESGGLFHSCCVGVVSFLVGWQL